MSDIAQRASRHMSSDCESSAAARFSPASPVVSTSRNVPRICARAILTPRGGKRCTFTLSPSIANGRYVGKLVVTGGHLRRLPVGQLVDNVRHAFDNRFFQS